MRKIKMAEIIEKGKAWGEKNQFWLGYAYAFGIICVGIKVLAKIFEPKYTGFVIDDARGIGDKYIISLKTYHKDRFGNEYGKMIFAEQDDVDCIMNALNKIKDDQTKG